MEFLTTSINIFGVKWYFLSIIIYLFSTLIVTEVVKKIIYFILKNSFRKRKFEKIKKKIQQSNLFPIVLSWIIGFCICFIIRHYQKELVNIACLIQFAFLTILLNGGYKIIKKRWKLWNNLRRNNTSLIGSVGNIVKKVWPKRKKEK